MSSLSDGAVIALNAELCEVDTGLRWQIPSNPSAHDMKRVLDSAIVANASSVFNGIRAEYKASRKRSSAAISRTRKLLQDFRSPPTIPTASSAHKRWMSR